jgi:hypothetical protein
MWEETITDGKYIGNNLSLMIGRSKDFPTLDKSRIYFLDLYLFGKKVADKKPFQLNAANRIVFFDEVAGKPFLIDKDNDLLQVFVDDEQRDATSEIKSVERSYKEPSAPKSSAVSTERGVDGVLLSSEESEAVGLEIGLTTEDLYIASNKVGIGTNSPSEKLEVVGNIKATAFIGSGALIENMYKLDANDGSPTSAIYVDASGNIGVGTTAPVSKFDIRGGLKIWNCSTCGSTNDGTLRYNSTTKTMQFCNGSAWQDFTQILVGCVYRWQVWSTYSNQCGWVCGNRTDLFAGVNPSSWGDGGYYATHMTSDKQLLQTFFNKKGYAVANAMVYAEYWRHYSSTDSRQCAVLFRIKNTHPSSAITWTPYFYFSGGSGWSEYASLALNGANNWTYGNAGINSTVSVSLSIPANRTSTVIVISASYYECGCCTAGRALGLAFYNNSLSLPTYLQFVDDLDVASGGWES